MPNLEKKGQNSAENTEIASKKITCQYIEEMRLCIISGKYSSLAPTASNS